MPHRYRSPVDIYNGVIDIKMIHNTHWNHCKASLTSKINIARIHFGIVQCFLVAGIGPKHYQRLTAHYGTHSDALGFNPSFLLLLGTNQH
jgi:hypothetical protein